MTGDGELEGTPAKRAETKVGLGKRVALPVACQSRDATPVGLSD